MPKKTASPTQGLKESGAPYINPEKLRKARIILGTATDAQTVDYALDFVITSREMEAAIETAFGSQPLFEVR
jgi:hypothetical protein